MIDTKSLFPTRKKYGKSGRPVECPFISDEVREDFIWRAQWMMDHFFDPSPQNTKRKIVFTSEKSIGKSTLWAIIYLHYLHKGLIVKENLNRIVIILTMHLGREKVGPREPIQKKVTDLQFMKVTQSEHLWNGRITEQGNYMRYRPLYEAIITIWESARE